MNKPTPFLWFDDQAEEAAKFYVSIFEEDSKIETVTHYNIDVPPRKKGSVMTVAFRLRGQGFIALNGGPSYKFTPAVSFSITCKDQKEIDRFWERLSAGGAPGPCGWLTDKFGLSWQVVPEGLGELLKSPKQMEAMMGMGKLDIAALERAG